MRAAPSGSAEQRGRQRPRRVRRRSRPATGDGARGRRSGRRRPVRPRESVAGTVASASRRMPARSAPTAAAQSRTHQPTTPAAMSAMRRRRDERAVDDMREPRALARSAPQRHGRAGRHRPRPHPRELAAVAVLLEARADAGRAEQAAANLEVPALVLAAAARPGAPTSARSRPVSRAAADRQRSLQSVSVRGRGAFRTRGPWWRQGARPWRRRPREARDRLEHVEPGGDQPHPALEAARAGLVGEPGVRGGAPCLVGRHRAAPRRGLRGTRNSGAHSTPRRAERGKAGQHQEPLGRPHQRRAQARAAPPAATGRAPGPRCRTGSGSGAG